MNKKIIAFLMSLILTASLFGGISAEASGELPSAAPAQTLPAEGTAEKPSEDIAGKIRLYLADQGIAVKADALIHNKETIMILADPLAALAGFTLSYENDGRTAVFTKGNYQIEIDTERETAEISFEMPGLLRINPYDTFTLKAVCILTDEETKESFLYLPLEQMLYMMDYSYMPHGGVVWLYPAPVTLWTAMADIDRSKIPGAADIYGDSRWGGYANAFRMAPAIYISNLDWKLYAPISGADRIDEEQWENCLIKLNAGYTNLETDAAAAAFENALKGYRADAAVMAENTDSLLKKVTESNSYWAELFGTTYDAFEKIDDITSSDELKEQVKKLTGWSAGKDIFGLSDALTLIGVGMDTISASIKAAETLKSCENWTDFYRMELLDLIGVNSRSNPEVAKKVNAAAEKVYGLFAGDWDTIEKNAFEAGMDVVLDLAGGMVPISGTILSVTNIVVGALEAFSPEFQNRLDGAAAYYRAEHLAGLSQMYIEELKDTIADTKSVSADSLLKLRLKAGMLMNLSAQTWDELYTYDKLRNGNDNAAAADKLGYCAAVTALIQESTEYDARLDKDTDFHNLYSEKEGSIRMEIPLEYVEILPLFKYSLNQNDLKTGVIKADLDGDGLVGDTITVQYDKYGYIEGITLKTRLYGTCVVDVSQFWDSQYWSFTGIHLGNGAYTYIIEQINEGTIGGSNIRLYSPADGVLTELAAFDDSSRMGVDMYFEGGFTSDSLIEGIMYPTGETVKLPFDTAADSYPQSRSGEAIWEGGFGWLSYGLREDRNGYDLIYSSYYKCLFNADTVAVLKTYITLKDGQLAVTKQTLNQYPEPGK